MKFYSNASNMKIWLDEPEKSGWVNQKMLDEKFDPEQTWPNIV